MSWDTFSKFLNLLLGLWVFYLYLENRKLKGLEIDKDIKIKEIEIEDFKNYTRTPEYIVKEVRGNLYENKLDKLNAELEHLKKIKRYKWIFSK